MQSLDVISINIWQMLASLGNLVILCLVVKKFLYKPVKKMLEARQNTIQGDYDAAREAKEQADADRKAYEEKLKTAKHEADNVIKSAVDIASEREKEIIAEAREKADGIVRQAENDAMLERKKAEDSIRKEIVEVSSLLTEKMLEREVSEADIITLGIGGNDWGAYLGWVMTEVQDNNKLPDEYVEELKSYLKSASFDDNIIAEIVNLAHQMNALDELIEAIPEAVMYGFGTYMENWDYLIQDIYDLNPDVTLVVVGMYSSKYSTTKEAPDVVIESEPFKAAVEQMIIDYANKPMIESKDKFGYIYVDTYGTTVEISHPNVAGNRFIADRILEALPDARFPYTDVEIARNSSYQAIEYMYLNDIMSGTSATTFSPDAVLTKAQLSEALNKITGTYEITDSDATVSKLNFAISLVKASAGNGFISLFKTLVFAMKIMFSGFGNVTRAEAAVIIKTFIDLL